MSTELVVMASSMRAQLSGGNSQLSRESNQTSEYLVFRLGAEDYAIDILKVREIRSYEIPTRIARAPAHVLGVVNLRGVIVPVMDLRIKLALPEAAYNDSTVAIILNVRERVVGAVVDSVSDVVQLDAQSVRPPPSIHSLDEGARFVKGMATMGHRMLILADIDELISERASQGEAAQSVELA